MVSGNTQDVCTFKNPMARNVRTNTDVITFIKDFNFRLK